jgi:hypothetical protein
VILVRLAAAAAFAILIALAAPFPSPTADRVRALPDTALTSEAADENVAAARIAGMLTGERPEILLALAWHESRFISNAVSREANGLVSCGIATPEPQAKCEDEPLVIQYQRGAEHLAGWRRALGDRALFGYAGGYRLNKACLAGSTVRGCTFPAWMESLANRIAGL